MGVRGQEERCELGLHHLLNVSENRLATLILQARSWTRYQEIAAQMAAKPPLNPYELQWLGILVTRNALVVVVCYSEMILVEDSCTELMDVN